MSKNIVICCDGTRGQYESEEKNTSVIRLFERLDTDGDAQVSYYDPGIGTYSPAKYWPMRAAAKAYASITGLGKKGAGLNGNIRQAYEYVMDNYEPGDKVFLFGYSRGAHTVRVLAAMLNKCGLLTKGSNNLYPYMNRIYENQNNETRASGFKKTFSRVCKPHFIGVFDTVASVGLIWRKQFSNRRLNEDVAYAYQAIATNERRWHFRPSIWEETNIPPGQHIEQVWFPGYHADVGGQNADRGISDIALEWMVRQAEAQGLQLRNNWHEELENNPLGTIEKSDKLLIWGIGARNRKIPEGANIHQSVLQRIEASEEYRRLASLPESYVEAK